MYAVSKTSLLRGLASFLACVATTLVLTRSPARAQSAGIETQTTVPGIVLTMSFEIPLNTTSAGLPTGTFVKATVTVNNPTAISFVNQPMVMRFGQKPDQILGVDDGTGRVGVVDPATGAWYHTIATIAANSSTTYTVTYGKLCAGRWAFAVRVGEKVMTQMVQWAGTNDVRCPGDESVNPQPASFYQLPWPSSIVMVTATASTTSTTTTINPFPVTSTVAAASTGLSGSSPGPTSSIRPGVPTSTLLSLDRLPSTVPTTLRTTTTSKSGSTARTTTTVVFCKTVGGKRYCAPKSSAYKPGQKKAIEVKPTPPTPKKKK